VLTPKEWKQIYAGLEAITFYDEDGDEILYGPPARLVTFLKSFVDEEQTTSTDKSSVQTEDTFK